MIRLIQAVTRFDFPRLVPLAPALILLVAIGGNAAPGISFTASVDRAVLDRSQTLTLTIEAEGAVSGLPDPELPDLSDFRVLSGPNESTTFQMINGRTSLTKSWSFVLKPKRAGTLTIGPAKIKVKGKTYQTDPITLTVTSPGTAAPPSAAPRAAPPKESPDLFVNVTPDKAVIYQNEQVVLTYTIYTRLSVNGYEISRLPSAPGFWTEEFDIPDQPVVTDETIGGRHYRKAVIRKVALFPTRAGKLTVDPLEVTCQVQVMDYDRRRRDPFDMLFDSPFMRYRTEERFIETEPLTLTVLPLPEEGKPANFKGAVGNFDMEVSLDRTQVKTDEALTMTVRFSGTGNLKLLDRPDFQAPPEFESYEPKETVQINRSGRFISGAKTYEYVLIPRVPGRVKIPPITFSYFDPKSRSYRTLTKGGFEIEVLKGEGGFPASVPGISKSDVKLLAEDISYLKTPGRLLRITSPYWIPTGYWVGMALPPVLALIIWWTARLLGAPSMKARRRSRLIYARAKKDLQAAAKSAGTEDIYGEIHRILLKYLGQKLDLPASGLKEEEVLKRLKEHRIPEDLLTDLREIFDECNQARFAPAGADPSLQHRLIKRSHRTLDALEARMGVKSSRTAAAIVLIPVLLILAAGPVRSQNSDLQKAAELYRNGDYTAAAQVYEKILQEGWHSGELYYNLGNCYYKAGDYGKAILNYERAQRFLGGDDDLQKNLKLANLHITDRIEPLPRIIVIRAFETVAGLFTVRQWAILFIISEWLLFVTVLSLYAIRRFHLRRLLAKALALFCVLTLLSGGFFLEQKIAKDRLVEGIVLADRVEVRSAPESGATELFTLHEGAKVRVLRTVSNWAEIRLADGKDGWLPLSAFAVI